MKHNILTIIFFLVCTYANQSCNAQSAMQQSAGPIAQAMINMKPQNKCEQSPAKLDCANECEPPGPSGPDDTLARALAAMVPQKDPKSEQNCECPAGKYKIPEKNEKQKKGPNKQLECITGKKQNCAAQSRDAAEVALMSALTQQTQQVMAQQNAKKQKEAIECGNPLKGSMGNACEQAQEIQSFANEAQCMQQAQQPSCDQQQAPQQQPQQQSCEQPQQQQPCEQPQIPTEGPIQIPTQMPEQPSGSPQQDCSQNTSPPPPKPQQTECQTQTLSPEQDFPDGIDPGLLSSQTPTFPQVPEPQKQECVEPMTVEVPIQPNPEPSSGQPVPPPIPTEPQQPGDCAQLQPPTPLDCIPQINPLQIMKQTMQKLASHKYKTERPPPIRNSGPSANPSGSPSGNPSNIQNGLGSLSEVQKMCCKTQSECPCMPVINIYPVIYK